MCEKRGKQFLSHVFCCTEENNTYNQLSMLVFICLYFKTIAIIKDVFFS